MGKRIALSLGLWIIFNTCFCQPGYDEATNGLSPESLSKFHDIVDSLNVRFENGDLSHAYYSLPQGFASFVQISDAGMAKAIEEGINWDAFKSRYPEAVVATETWIVKRKFTDYKGTDKVEYFTLPGKKEISLVVNDTNQGNVDSGWVMNENRSNAIYLTGLKRTELPHDYARLVQYVDCMIDTTARIYFRNAKYCTAPNVSDTSLAAKFLHFADTFDQKPATPDQKIANGQSSPEARRKYILALADWNAKRLVHLDSVMKYDTEWKGMLVSARNEAIQTGNSSDRLEYYIARYLSKEDALNLKRDRHVVGTAKDDRPYYHALSICELAGETSHWDIFLRSNLDAMNAWFEGKNLVNAGEQLSSLNELENLGIPATNLLIGTCLRVDNVSQNHYWGTVAGVGRALAEASDKEPLEDQLLSMIEDNRLDPFNRLLLAFAFRHYTGNLDFDLRADLCKEKLKEALSTFPDFMQQSW